MKDIIRISWDSGYYALIPEKFFPTTMEKTRKVFKLMLADPACCSVKRKTAGGFRWRWVNE